MAGITIRLSGAPETMARLRGYSRDVIDKASIAATYALGNAVLAKALPITPKRHGTLRASGQVTIPTIVNGKAQCTVGFGGAAKAYASVQHDGYIERNGIKHFFSHYTEPGTGPLFLDKAAEAIIPHAEQIFRQAFDAVLKGGKGGGRSAPHASGGGGGGGGGGKQSYKPRKAKSRGHKK